ncbi:hypothetical protein MSPP1_002290 [Malassezia sp. CBS 17886]|nr:hypothetical protein MSPP1_002290 [Malassezia sp. CBS 17886]
MPEHFSSSEVNLLVYHYLKESGFLHTCFALRYEARLDDLPAAHEPVVEPGQLLSYLQRGMLYATAERAVEQNAAVDSPKPLLDTPRESLRLTPTPATPAVPRKWLDAASQTPLPREPTDANASLLAPREHGAGDAPVSAAPLLETSAKRTASVRWDGKDRGEKRSRSGDADSVDAKTASRQGIVRMDGGVEGEGEASPAGDDAEMRHPSEKATKGRKTSASSRHAISGAARGSPKGRSPDAAESPADDDKDATMLSGHSAEVFVAAWNPTVPGLLASGAGDATVRIWDLKTEKDDSIDPPAVCKHLPPTQAKNISTLAWNPDGTLLASGSYDGILRLWTPQGDLHLVMSMHQGPIFAVRWNAKGNLLLTGSADGTAIVWDVSSGRTRQQFSLHSDNVLDVQWLTDGSDYPATDRRPEQPNQAAADAVFATCSADNCVLLWKIGEPKPIRSFLAHTDEVNSIRFDPSQTLLASASDDGTARIWAVDASGVAAHASPSSLALDAPKTDAKGSKSIVHTLRGHTKELYALAWCPTGPETRHPEKPRMLATSSFDKTARLWNGDTGDCLRVIDGHKQSVYALCFSPCALYLATGGIDAQVLDGHTAHKYTGGGPVMDLAWHVDEGAHGDSMQLDSSADGRDANSAQARGAPRATTQLAVAQADRRLVVLDLSARVDA